MGIGPGQGAVAMSRLRSIQVPPVLAIARRRRVGRHAGRVPGSYLVRHLAPEEVEVVGSALGLARLYQGDGFYLVAWEGEEPMGHLHLALSDPPELQDVIVRPEYRRRGVARRLSEAAEAEARARGFGRLRLTVSIDNSAAQALYNSCGFADTGKPHLRVQGTVQIRTGPIEVDDTLLTWEKVLGGEAEP